MTEKKKPGKPAHVPTPESRKQVAAMISFGIPQEEVCKVIGVSVKTLYKYYREEIDTAAAKANAKVASMLYTKCMKEDTASIIFWLKTRAKWAEKNEVDLTIRGLQGILDEIDGTSRNLPES